MSESMNFIDTLFVFSIVTICITPGFITNIYSLRLLKALQTIVITNHRAVQSNESMVI